MALFGEIAREWVPEGNSWVSAGIPPMAHFVLAVFLLVFGFNLLFGLSLPMWLIGTLAVAAGGLLLLASFKVRIGRK